MTHDNVAEDATGNPTSVTGYFRDDIHALQAGMIYGTLMKAGITFRPEMDDGGRYMPRFCIELPPLDELGPPVTVWLKILAEQGAL